MQDIWFVCITICVYKVLIMKMLLLHRLFIKKIWSLIKVYLETIDKININIIIITWCIVYKTSYHINVTNILNLYLVLLCSF
jgi:hypothetical protein